MALARGARELEALLKRELVARRLPVTHGGGVGQVWRGGGSRRARLARLLAGVKVTAMDETLGRRAGALLARTRTKDVIDAAVVLLAVDGDTILTSDPADLAPPGSRSTSFRCDLLVVLGVSSILDREVGFVFVGRPTRTATCALTAQSSGYRVGHDRRVAALTSTR